MSTSSTSYRDNSVATTTYSWLILLCPLVGMTLIGLTFNRLPGRSAGWIATAAIALAFAFAIATLVSLLGHPASDRQLTSSLWEYDVSVGVDAKMSILVHQPSVFMSLLV